MGFSKLLKKKRCLAYQEVWRGVAELDAGGLRLRQIPSNYAPFGAFLLSTRQKTRQNRNACRAGV